MNTALKTILEELLIQLREKLFLFQPQILAGATLLYDFYFSKVLPLAIKSDYCFCMKPMPFTPSGIKLGFWDKNFLKRKLSTLLKTMMKEAVILLTTAYVLVTRTTMLFDSETPEATIQKCTGHRSLSASSATSNGFQYPCQHPISRE